MGKLFVEPHRLIDSTIRLVELASQCDVAIVLNSLDPEDEQAIDSLIGVGEGTTFSISDHPGTGGATGLWNEAHDLAYSVLTRDWGHRPFVTPEAFGSITWPSRYTLEMKDCRLYKLLHGLALLPDYVRIGIEFLEAGPESVLQDNAESCIEAILRTVVLHWDCAPGTLYSWPRPDTGLHGQLIDVSSNAKRQSVITSSGT
jgi:hypothetical protein